MNAKKIQIGMVYSAKCDGTFLPVRITGSLGHGRYEGVNLRTDADVKVSTASIKGGGQTLEDWKARQTAKDEPAAPVAPPDTHVGAGSKKSAKADKPAKERKPSGLDAAAAVLAEAGEPLNCKTIVEQMLAKGLWKTGGKTPAATIYSALLRSIQKDGAASRFRKVDRGRFELVK